MPISRPSTPSSRGCPAWSRRWKASLPRPNPPKTAHKRAKPSSVPLPRAPSFSCRSCRPSSPRCSSCSSRPRRASGRPSSTISASAAAYEQAVGAALGDDLDAAADEAAPSHWRLTTGEADPLLPDGATPLSQFVSAPPALKRRLAADRRGRAGARQGFAGSAEARTAARVARRRSLALGRLHRHGRRRFRRWGPSRRAEQARSPEGRGASSRGSSSGRRRRFGCLKRQCPFRYRSDQGAAHEGAPGPRRAWPHPRRHRQGRA